MPQDFKINNNNLEGNVPAKSRTPDKSGQMPSGMVPLSNSQKNFVLPDAGSRNVPAKKSLHGHEGNNISVQPTSTRFTKPSDDIVVRAENV